MNRKLAILGGTPAFDRPVKKQNYLPAWDQFASMIDGIFSRKYYTNHGPLAQELEKKLSAFFGAKHAICMTNTGIGLMIAMKALDLKGKVILPAFSDISLAQAIIWAGLEPVFCDIDESSLHLRTDLLREKIKKDTAAISGVNLFGGSCDLNEMEKIAAGFSLKQFYVSDDAIGEQYNKTKIGNFGILEIFSLHESNIINSTDGCVITTNDDHVAARLRNIRSSYGAGVTVPIDFTGNGRMSEVQAGMALLTLGEFENNRAQNQKIAEQYENALSNVEGLSVYKPQNAIDNRNYKRIIVKISSEEFGLNAAGLSKTLHAENVLVKTFARYARNPFAPFNSLQDMPAAAKAISSLLEIVPDREHPDTDGAEKLGQLLQQVQADSKKLAGLFSTGS